MRRGRKAEISWAADARAIVWVGSRPLHQYWPLLAPYFRDVLLAPQRKPGAEAVAWTWEDRAEGAPDGAELNAVRKRLTRDAQLFAEHFERAVAAGAHTHAGIEQLSDTMSAAMAELVAKPDAEFARYVCRAAAGLRLHSWSAANAAPVVDDGPRVPAATETHETITARRAPRDETSARGKRRRRSVLLLGLLGLVIGTGVYLRRSDENDRSSPSAKRVGSLTTETSSTEPAPDTTADAAQSRGSRPQRRDENAARDSSPGFRRAAARESEWEAEAATRAGTRPAPQAEVERPIVVPGSPLGVAPPVGTPLGAAHPIDAIRPPAAARAEKPEGDAGQNAVAAESGAAAIKTPPAQPQNEDASATIVRSRVVVRPGEVAPTDDENLTQARGRAVGRERDEKETAAPIAAEAIAADYAPRPAMARPAMAARTRILRMQLPTWTPRLVEDRIVPTQPVRSGQKIDRAQLRAAMLDHVRASQPAWFRHAGMRYGCTFTGSAPLQFAGPAPRKDVRIVGSAQRAEVSWVGGGGDALAGVELRDAAGAGVVRFEVIADGTIALEVAEDLHVACWVECESLEAGAQPEADARCEWRTASGTPLGVGSRVTLASPSTGESPSFAHIALVDRVSGWGLVAATP